MSHRNTHSSLKLPALRRGFPLRTLPLVALVAVAGVLTAGCALSSDFALPGLPPVQVSFVFTTANLPNGFSGAPYSATLTTNGVGPVLTSCAITSPPGSFPPRLTMNVSGTSCQISGTIAVILAPGTSQTFTFTVRAVDSNGQTTSRTFTILVATGYGINPFTFGNGTQGRAFSFAITTTLGAGSGQPPLQPDPTGCTAVGLPAGLAIGRNPADTNGCIVTGTPTVNGVFAVTITTRDSATVPNVVSFGPTNLTVNPPLTVPAFVLANGTQGRAFSAAVSAAGGQAPLTVCNGAGQPAGITVTLVGGNCLISGTPTVNGLFNITLNVTDSPTTSTASGNAASAATPVTINPPLAVTAFVLGNGTQGSPFSETISTTGGESPLTACSAVGLPGGLGIAPSGAATCLISGTPTANGAFNVTVTATDTATATTAAGNASSAATPLTVNPTFVIPPFVLGTAAEGAPYSVTIPTSGGNLPVTGCATTAPLPAGLAIAVSAPSSCVISGTPAAGASAGSPYSITVQATDTASTSTAATTATSAATPLVVNGPLNIPAFVLGNGTESRAFQQDIPVTGGIQPLTSCIISAGALPAGLAIAVSPAPGNCRISGAPTVNGLFNITVQATDTGAPPTTPPVTATSASTPLTINPPLAITSAPALPDGVIGRTYTLALASTGGNAPINWTNPTGNAGTLNTAVPACNGLSLSGAGGISGTSTAPAGGVCTFDARATDTASSSTAAASTQVTFNFNVQPPLTAVLTQAGNATPNVSLFDGALGRSYGVIGATPTWTASGGLGGYTWCVSTGAASIPGGMVGISTGCGAPTPGAVVTLTSANVTGGAGVFFFTVQLNDPGNAAVPPGNTLNNTLININAAMTVTVNVTLAGPAQAFTANGATTNPDGVIGRAYGPTAALNADPTRVFLTFNATGGIPNGAGGYLFLPSTGLATLPPGFTCNPGLTTLPCGSILGPGFVMTATGIFNYGISTTDTGNLAVPAQTIDITNTMTVNPDLAAGVSPASPFPDAVNNRRYGSGVGCSPGPGCTPITYTVAPATGLPGPGGTYIFAVPAVLPFPTGINCTPVANVFTCAAAVSVTGAVGAYTPTVTINDIKNATTTDFTTANGGALVTIGGAMNVIADLNISAIALANGTVGRPFGTGTGGNVDLPFTGGIGPYACSSANFPATLAAAAVGAASPCRITGTPGAGGSFPTTQVNVTDTGNAAAPSGLANTGAMPLTVNDVLTITTTSPLPGATTSVAYTQTFTNTGGQTPFTWSIIAGAQFTGNNGNVGTPCEGLSMSAAGVFSGTPPNVGTCGPFTVQVADTATATTAAGNTSAVFNVVVTTALAINPFVLGDGTQGRAFTQIVTVAGGDGTLRADPNGCVISAGALPAGVTFVRNPANTNECIFSGTPTVNGAFSVTVSIDDAVGGNPPDVFGPVNFNSNAVLTLGALSLTNGTEGRAFGGAPSTIPITGGEAPYTCSDSATLPAGLVVNAVGTDCVISGTPAGGSAAGSPYAITITVADSATASTANGSDPSNVSNININVPLAITTGAALPDGVEGRTYTLTLAASGGEGAFTWSQVAGATLADDPGCAGLTFNATGDIGGSTTSVGIGACSFAVQVADTATTTTASGTNILVLTMTIQPPLTITSATLPNSLRNFTYFPTGTPGATVTATGGTGGPTAWTVTAGTFTLNAGNFDGDAATPCEGLTINGAGTPLNTLITGTPVNPGTCSFTLQVSDSGSGPAPGGSASQALSIIVLNTFAYAEGTGTNSVEVFNTTSNTLVTSIALGAGTGPDSVAVTTNGRFAYVTLRTTGQLAVIDTTTNTPVVGSPFNLASCAAPRGITAVNLVGLGERVYVACDGDTVVGWDVATNTQVATITPVSTAVGVPYGIAVTPDQSRLYVTIDLATVNGEVAVINTATDTVTTQIPLVGDCVGPRGIATNPNGLEAYVACSGQGGGVGRGTILDTDPGSVTFNTNTADTVALGTTGARVPEGAAVTPDGARVYFTLGGVGGGLPEFSVMDVATQAVQGIVGSGLSVPNPAVAPGGNTLPTGVTIPDLTPVPGTGYRVYMTMRGTVGPSNAPGAAVINNATPTPTANTSIAATAASAPRGIAHIPVPR